MSSTKLYVTNSVQNTLTSNLTHFDALLKWDTNTYKVNSSILINDIDSTSSNAISVINDGNLKNTTPPPGETDDNWSEIQVVLAYNMLYTVLLSDSSGNPTKHYLLTPSYLNGSLVSTNTHVFFSDVEIDLNPLVSSYLTENNLSDKFLWSPKVLYSDNETILRNATLTETDMLNSVYLNNYNRINNDVELSENKNYHIIFNMLLNYTLTNDSNNNSIRVNLNGLKNEKTIVTDNYPNSVDVNSVNVDNQLNNNNHLTSLNVSWDPPSDSSLNNVSEGLNYDVILKSNNSVVVVSENTTTNSVSLNTDTIPDPSYGETFEITIVSKNALSDQDAALSSTSNYLQLHSSSINLVLEQAPSAPVDLNVNTVQDASGSLLVDWKEDHNGGQDVTSFNIYYSDGNTDLSLNTGNNNLQYTLEGLNQGVEYTINVQAVNVNGAGAKSASAVGTPATVPLSAPTDVSVNRVEGSGTSLLVSWNECENNGGSEVTNYIVTLVNTENSSDVSSINTSNTNHLVENLLEGVEYSITVKAENAFGVSAVSSDPIVLNPATLPQPPTIVELDRVVDSSNSLTVSWEANPLDGGEEIINYIVNYSDGVTDLSSSTNSNNTSLVIDNLVQGVVYTVNVKSENELGISVNSSDDSSLNPATVPLSKVLNVDIDRNDNDNTQLLVSWSKPLNNGGEEITNYIIYYSTSSSSFDLSVNTNSPDLSYTLTDLSAGVNYYLYILSQNEVGVSDVKSNTVSLNPASAPLTPPTNLDLDRVEGSGTSLLVSWDEPLNNGGEPITNYEITFNGQTKLTNSSNTSYTLDGLDQGVTYTITVRSRNIIDWGPSSTESSLNPALVPNTPYNVVIDRVENDGIPDASKLTVTWSEPDNRGDDISEYQLIITAVDNESGSTFTPAYNATSATNNYTLEGLTAGIKYGVRIAATNDVGTGSYSSETSLVSAKNPEINSGFLNVSRSTTNADRIIVTTDTNNLDNGGLSIDETFIKVVNHHNDWVRYGYLVTSEEINGLTPGQQYTVQIKVDNGEYESVRSNGGVVDYQLNYVEQTVIPGIEPDNVALSLSYVSNDSYDIKLDWSVNDFRGSVLTDYSVEITIVDGSNETLHSETTSTTQNTYTWQFSPVEHMNAIGATLLAKVTVNTNYGNAVSNQDSKVISKVPDSPMVYLVNTTGSAIQVRINSNSENGSDITHHLVTIRNENTDIDEVSNDSVSETSGMVSKDYDLTNGDRFTVSVVSVNSRGSSMVMTSEILNHGLAIITKTINNLSSTNNIPVMEYLVDSLYIEGASLNNIQVGIKVSLIEEIENNGVVTLSNESVYIEGTLDSSVSYSPSGELIRTLSLPSTNVAGSISNHSITKLRFNTSEYPLVKSLTIGNYYKFRTVFSSPTFDTYFVDTERIIGYVTPKSVDNLLLETIDNNTLKVSWNNNDYENNDEFDGYAISFISEDVDFSGQDLTENIDISLLSSITRTAFYTGQNYVVTVNPYIDGLGEAPDAIVSGKPFSNPSISSVSVLHTETQGTIDVQVDITTNGSNSKLRYEVKDPSGNTVSNNIGSELDVSYEVVVTNDDVNSALLNISGLENNILYDIILTLLNENNETSSSQSVSTKVYNKLDVPTNVLLTKSLNSDNGNAELKLTFNNPPNNHSADGYRYDMLVKDDNNEVVKTDSFNSNDVTNSKEVEHTLEINNIDLQLGMDYYVVLSVSPKKNEDLLSHLASDDVSSNKNYASLNASNNINSFINFMEDPSNNYINRDDNKFSLTIDYDLELHNLRNYNLIVKLYNVDDTNDRVMVNSETITNHLNNVVINFNNKNMNSDYELDVDLTIDDFSWNGVDTDTTENVTRTVSIPKSMTYDNFGNLTFNLGQSEESNESLQLNITNISLGSNKNNLPNSELKVITVVNILDLEGNIISSQTETNPLDVSNLDISVNNVDYSAASTDISNLQCVVSLTIDSDLTNDNLNTTSTISDNLYFRPELLTTELVDNSYNVRFYNGFTNGQLLYFNTGTLDKDAGEEPYVETRYVADPSGINTVSVRVGELPEDGDLWLFIFNKAGASIFQVYGGSIVSEN